MKNKIYTMNIIYIQDDYSGEFQVAVAKSMEEFITQFPLLTIQLQNWSWDEKEYQGQILWSLSRKLSHHEEAEIRSQWEDDQHQVQFYAQRRLF